jgi:rod shape-determining protein MreD
MRGIGMLALGIVVVLLLRSTALSALAARGVVLDVLAFAVIVWSLRHGASWGATFGFAIGLAADLDATHWLGRHALVLSLVGYVVGSFARTLVRESGGTQFVLFALATAAHQAWVVPFELGGIEGLLTGWPYLLQRIVVGAFATAPAGTLVLVVARRLTGRPLFGHALAQSG